MKRTLTPRNHHCLYGVLIISLFFNTSTMSAQGTDYTLMSSDNQIAMEIARAQYGINITVILNNARELDYVSVEKSAEPIVGYRQCKYIELNKTTEDSVVIVQHDVYPLVYSEDVFYRVKTVSKEGIARTYPSVRLPGYAKPVVAN